MAAAEFTLRRRSGSVSCSIQSEQDLLIKDEANFSAMQAVKEYEQELLDLDPERVRVYLDVVSRRPTLKNLSRAPRD